jgi:hypothetical protein
MQSQKKDRRKWERPFLKALADCPNVTGAAELAGVSRVVAYEHRNTNSRFAAEWDEAIEAAIDKLEEAVYRRSSEGARKPVFYQGKKCGYVREFSDTLAALLLRSHRPAVYAAKDTDQSAIAQEVAALLLAKLKGTADDAGGTGAKSKGQ